MAKRKEFHKKIGPLTTWGYWQRNPTKWKRLELEVNVKVY